MKRNIHRSDKLQIEIVKGLRDVGAKVAITSRMGEGFPDILVKFRGVLHLMEIKSKGGKLTQDEVNFFSDWCDVTTIVYSLDDALRIIGAT